LRGARGPQTATRPAQDAPELGPSEELVVGPQPGHERRAAEQAPTFDQFYDREMPRLIALACALAGPAVADDLAQEAMITAYRRWNEVRAYEHPESWVRRVCANAAVSLLRHRAAETRALLRLGSRPQTWTLDPVSDGFWDEVRRLPRRQAQAVALRYVYDLELADIARTMGCSEGSVKVHLNRARASLAARLATSEGVGP
jgi:RNA polymerase sigma factor (sigma-70 family)